MSSGRDRLEGVRRHVEQVARALRIEHRETRLLRDGNHTTVHLWPSAIVARVVTAEHPRRAHERLPRELDVARHLADLAAPIVPPTSDPVPGPHEFDGGALTLWTFTRHRAADDDRDGAAAALAYRTLADALASYSGPLPSFAVELEDCRTVLDELVACRKLDFEDAARLREALDVGAIDERSERPLHGDPHLGNVLITDLGPRWTDLESVCRGPIEWDLSSLPGDAVDVLPPHDPARLDALRRARSACVAVWCLAMPDPSPAQRDAARFHLDRVRATLTT